MSKVVPKTIMIFYTPLKLKITFLCSCSLDKTLKEQLITQIEEGKTLNHQTTSHQEKIRETSICLLYVRVYMCNPDV